MKNAFWIIAIILLVAIIYFVYQQKQKDKQSVSNLILPTSQTIFDPMKAPCPANMGKIGDGSACQSLSNSSIKCALWGNTGMVRCYDAVGNPVIIKNDGTIYVQASTSNSVLPPVVQGASLSNASCVNTVQVQNLIKKFKESGPLQFGLRNEIKGAMATLCPEGLRYLIRD